MHVTRVVNGSQPAQYLAGDYFTVELDYAVTGTQYAISIVEELPAGWSVADSSAPFTSTGSKYVWNISSPLNGVGSGKIFYLVHIPDGAGNGSYEISGEAGWFSSYSDVKLGVPTGTAPTGTTSVTVASMEGSGPCVWISGPAEMAGDGDGHLEAGETAQFRFDIWDKSGISGYQIKVNGNNTTPDSESGDSYHKYGVAHAPVIANADPNDLVNTFSIEASSPDGESILTLPVYVPNYHYTLWVKGEWNGFAAESATFEPYSSPIDGGWTYLYGGNKVNVPQTSIYYNGPPVINRRASGTVAPFFGWPGISGISGTASATVNVTPRGVHLPYSNYSIYSEYMGANDVSASFNGTQEMLNKEFHVILVNLSAVTGRLDPTNLSSLASSLKGLTLEDIKNGEMGSVDKMASIGSCEFYVDGHDIPALNDMGQGAYALLILDYSLPNTPCLVSAAPFIVTKNGLSTTQVGPMAMPGDPVTLNEKLLGGTAPGAEYIYVAAMVPESDFSANLTATTDGSVNGTTLAFDGLTLAESINVASDGTKEGTVVTVHGKAGDYVLGPSDLNNSTKLRDIVMAEFNSSNIAMTVSEVTGSVDKDITLLTRDTMPTGRYIVTSMVLDRKTGNVAAVNQTTVMLGVSYTYNLIKGWNLISVPIDLQDNSIEGFFPANVRNDVWDLWGWNSSVQTWTYWSIDPDSPYWHFEHITTMDAGKGYWVNMNNNTSFTIQGTVPPGAPNAPTPLVTNWNLVGITGFVNQTPGSMYPNGWDVWGWKPLEQNWKYWSNDPDSPYWHFEYMTEIPPGEGIWVNMQI